jgi:hypothetical protein
MFCEIDFISRDGIGCSVLLHISNLLRDIVGIFLLVFGISVLVFWL